MTEAERRTSVSMTPWLEGVVLLVAVAAPVITFVPLAACRECHSMGVVYVLMASRLRSRPRGKRVAGRRPGGEVGGRGAGGAARIKPPSIH
jgi:hypothetical protein